MHDDPRYLSVRRLARRWGISPARVRALIRRGDLQALDLGDRRRQLRIPPEAIRAFEEGRTVRKPSPRRQRVERIDPEIAAILGE